METALEDLRLYMQENIFSKETPEGFLTSQLSEYYQCIELNKTRLEELYTKDKNYWQQMLTGIK